MMEASMELARCKAEVAAEFSQKSRETRRTAEEAFLMEQQLNQANLKLDEHVVPKHEFTRLEGKLLAMEVRAEAALEAAASSERLFREEQLPLLAELKQKDFTINSLRDEIASLSREAFREARSVENGSADSGADGWWFAEHSLAEAAVLRLEHQASLLREEHDHEIKSLEGKFELELKKLADKERAQAEKVSASERHLAMVHMELEQCQQRAQLLADVRKNREPADFDERSLSREAREAFNQRTSIFGVNANGSDLRAEVAAMETLAQVRGNELENARHELKQVKAIAQGSICELETTARKEVDQLVHLSKAENIGRMIGAAQFSETLRTTGLYEALGREQRHRRAGTVAKVIAYHAETLGYCFWQWHHAAVQSRVERLGKLLDAQSSANQLLVHSLQKWRDADSSAAPRKYNFIGLQ